MPAPRPITERPRTPGVASPYGANAKAFQAYNNQVKQTGGRYTEGAWTEFANAYNAYNPSAVPANPRPVGGGGGGGGRGRGGGGGGGGGGGMSQAMFDAALKVLGQQPGQLALQQAALPAFRGQNLAAFNPAVYNQARQQLATAVGADRAAVTQQGAITNQALRDNYQNHYAQAQGQVQSGAEPVQGAGVAAQAGVNTQPMQQANQALAGDSQAAFTNLLGVLSAASQQSQASRLNQQALDQQTALRNIGVQNTALTGQIGMGQQQAYQAWLQRDEERRNQNNMLQQQWAREALMRNQDLENQQRTTNYTTQNETMQSRLQPLLDLIMSTQGTKVDTAALVKMLSGGK